MSESNARRRGPTLAAVGAILAVFVAGVLWSGPADADRNAASSVLDELHTIRDQLGTVRDSTAEQLSAAGHLLDWFEETEAASSGGLIESLARIRQRHEAPRALETVEVLTATGQFDRIRDPSTRRRLLTLNRRLGELATTGEKQYELYRTQLEQALSPAMWRLIFWNESGRGAIDYKKTVFDLDESGFELTMRSLLRGIEAYHTALVSTEAEVAALIETLAPSGARSEP